MLSFESCIQWRSFLMLLMIVHAMHCLRLFIPSAMHIAMPQAVRTTNTPVSSLNCSMGSKDNLFINFIVPKNSGIDTTKIYYKNDKMENWTLAKTYNTSEIAEISDWIETPFQPTTLYRARVFSEKSGKDIKLIGECEFCTHTDTLEQVRNLTVHSVGPNWFALKWTMPDRICPKNVTYEITYHDDSEPIVWEEWKKTPGYPITLDTKEQYVMIMEGVHPNKTYEVWFVLKVEEGPKFQSKVSTISVQTPQDVNPPVTTVPPVVLNATNTSLRVSVKTNCKNHCKAVWQFKELDESAWHFAGKSSVDADMEITGLNSTTVYQVRALLQRHTDCQPYESDNVPFVENTTLPIAEPKIVDIPPKALNVTNTTLTMVTDCAEECKGYIAHWEYRKSEETTWKYAGQESAHRKMIIGGLEQHTYYEVRYNLQWPTGRRIFNDSGPEEMVQTCSNGLLPIHHMWADTRRTHSIKISWMFDNECKPPYVLLRWKSFDINDVHSEEYSSDSYDANKCPINATLLEVNNVEKCYTSNYCYTANTNITPGNRYVFEIAAMNWENKCSVSETTKTSSLFKYWGGISVGLWVLIVLGVTLLGASVPVCIVVKKRLAARVAAGRDVAFSTSTNEAGDHEEGNGDGDTIIFPELSSRILDRRNQPLDT